MLSFIKLALVMVSVHSSETLTKTVAKKLLQDILPRYGFPHMIGSDNGLAFVSKASQDVAKFIGAD